MARRRFAVLETIEWVDEDGQRGRASAGEVRDDIPPAEVGPLLESGALEPYDAKAHDDGWYSRRYGAELDKATVKAGGIPRVEVVSEDRDVRTGDAGRSEDK